ncbi:MAG: SLBB domain-containing protein, partial [Spirochaetaceae bacterium]|nr:SLBB domain-containing protein [Spirochaetaceae bacterium]
QASRNGDMSQNPYLRPGDTVELRRAERQVSVQGEVYRNGSYQLLPGEQLTEIVERYADGLTATALPTEVRITRTGDSPRQDSSSLYVDLTDAEQRENISLTDGDRVVIPSKMQYRPVVYFEGALVSDGEIRARESEAGASSTGKTSRYTRIEYRFEPGEKLSTALKAMQSRYRLESELQSAYLVRSDRSETLAVDIESYLLSRQSEDPELQNGDTIVIPFKQLFVVVSGGVRNPGIYDYVQGRSYDYYVSLAGGVDKSMHWFGEHPKITDDQGNRLSNTAVIEPEYRIHYSHNNPFRVITPIAATLSTVVSTILVVQNLVQ